MDCYRLPPPASCLPPPASRSVGQCATLACLWEVSAPKPGNVHRGADFPDATLEDFLLSAVAIGPALEAVRSTGVGPAILQAVRATRQWVTTNTNLGMVLLLGPLAAVSDGVPWKPGIGEVLRNLTPADSAAVYEAIRLAQAGGMGQVGTDDVSGTAPASLLDAMQLAADRDLVARQYVTDFATVLELVVPWLLEGMAHDWSLPVTIVRTHVRLLAAEPDSLIARKRGVQVAAEAARFAAAVLEAGLPGDEAYHAGLADLDFWLRSDGNARNPGTTADLIAAGLFVLARSGCLPATRESFEGSTSASTASPGAVENSGL